MIDGIKIGDGTAPPGFPAYSRYYPDGYEGQDLNVICNFNGCGHKGVNGRPCRMQCGKNCSCPCCRVLAGGKEYGVTIG